jgi:hypothetical protein
MLSFFRYSSIDPNFYLFMIKTVFGANVIKHFWHQLAISVACTINILRLSIDNHHK